jgi:hypothetical protein
MKNQVLAILTAASILISLRPANASQTGTAVTVTSIVVFSGGSFDAQFSANICNDVAAPPAPPVAMNWGQAKTTYAGTTADGLKLMLSSLQAAKLSGSTVTVNTSGFDWGCKITGIAF